MPIKLSKTKIITPGIPKTPTTKAVIKFSGIEMPSELPNVLISQITTIPKRIFTINSINLLVLTLKMNLANNKTTAATIIICK